MTLRLNYGTASPEAYQMMVTLESHVRKSGLDYNLYELIKLRASQINGCSFCINMHANDLLKSGEELDRVLMLSVWREVPLYSDKEKAVLDLTECVTQLSVQGVPQHVYENVRRHVDEKEYVSLIMAINVINCWNRLAVSTGMFHGCMN
ncbi:carboxymuconolactone decarboxylase family protein [Paenibacillus camelliae]|uniref:carboxymuconolactone decarboxylase family protein n=1 Tax=Paenibacillus camelliae TaxID=512410 RepID=UPI00204049C9|nr:carboxymuconolactone decarboxylase family protein [Paenibacillus camelliae]MCM3634686.1 carboxymuconolactone decarboxylase family protein [Paenibacillus camelliae]